MADDDATPRSSRSTARGSRPPAKRATTDPVGPAAKKAVAKKAASKRSTAAPAAKASPAAAKKAMAKKAVAKKVAPATKAPSSRRKATADEAATARPAAPRRKASGGGAVLSDLAGAWEAPASEPAAGPEPVAADPASRRRALLRATAARLEHRDVDPVAAAPPPPPPPPPAPPVAEPEPVTEEFPADAPEMDDVAQVEEIEQVDEAAPDTVEHDAAPAPPPVATTPPPVTSAPPPQPPSPPTAVRAEPARAEERRGGGAGLSVLAIVLAVVVPVVGAIVALVLAARARRRDLPLAGVARIVAVVALLGWVLGIGGGVAINRNQGVDYSKLKVGDCFDSSSSNQVRGVKVKSCAKPHDSEVFFLVTHPAGKAEPYPGKDALVQFAADSCLGQPLTQYLGVPLEQSKLKDFEIVPQASAWKDGRRLLVCGLDTGGQGRITGSVKGSRR